MERPKGLNLGLWLALSTLTSPLMSQNGKAPNLVYVFPDQFRKQALEFWATPQYKEFLRTKADPVKTPHLNRFASESVVFTHFISNCPLSSPHRGSLMTGLFPGSTGVPLNINSTRPVSSLRRDVTCFGDVLNEAGYETAYIGKWHLDYPTPNDPANPGHYVDPRTPAWDAYTPKEQRHGFQYWYSYGTWDVHKDPHYYDSDGKRHEPGEYSPRHEADKAIAYLKNRSGERNPEKPFALFVSMNPPHSPYRSLEDCLEEDFRLYSDIPPEKLLVRDNADRKMAKAKSAPYYFANVTGVDREFGRIIEQLKELGEYENTIIVFTSDHGETMCSHGTTDPKNSIYSESVDVPFLIRWPGLKEAGISDLLMGTPDIMPTLLGLLGLKAHIPSALHGQDYSGIIKGETGSHRPESALYIRNNDGEKDTEGKVISYFPVARGIKTHQFTLELIINKEYELAGSKLFNDAEDPYQLSNLPLDTKNPAVQNLLKEMAHWLKISEDPWHKNKILGDLIPYASQWGE